MRSEKEIRNRISDESIELKPYYQGWNNALKWVLEK